MCVIVKAIPKSMSLFHCLSINAAHPLMTCHLSNMCRSHMFMLHTRSPLYTGLMEDPTDDIIANTRLFMSCFPQRFFLGYQSYHSLISCPQYSQLPSCSTKTIQLNHKLPWSYIIVYQNCVLKTLTFLPGMPLISASFYWKYVPKPWEVCQNLCLLDTVSTLKF